MPVETAAVSDHEGQRLVTHTVQHDYVTQNGRIVRETVTTDGTVTAVMDFIYDESGRPFALNYSTDGSSFTTYYYLLNLQGDVVALIDDERNTVASYTYSAWGNILSTTGELAEANPLRYRGYYYDTETGFYYLQSRYYDPANHRFINADGYASTGQGFVGTNMFAYCLNNPVQRIDFGGTASWHYSVMLSNEGPLYNVSNPSPKSIAMREEVNQILSKPEYSESIWYSQDISGRQAILEQLTGELTAIMGISLDTTAPLAFLPAYDGRTRGLYDHEHKQVCFAADVPNYMDYTAIRTLVHELYHAYQHAAVEDKVYHMGEPYALVQLWEINFREGNYIGEPHNQYYNQPVEISAFWFSNNIDDSCYIGTWGGYYGK